MSKQITLREAYGLIQTSKALLINGQLCYTYMDEVVGDPTNEWLHCSFPTEGFTYYHYFDEHSQEILFDGTNIIMRDVMDEPVKITLLVPMEKSV